AVGPVYAGLLGDGVRRRGGHPAASRPAAAGREDAAAEIDSDVAARLAEPAGPVTDRMLHDPVAQLVDRTGLVQGVVVGLLEGRVIAEADHVVRLAVAEEGIVTGAAVETVDAAAAVQ